MVALANNAESSPPPVTPQTHTPVSLVQVSGLRYYKPELGRWVNRDPLGDTAFVLQRVDRLLAECTIRGSETCVWQVENHKKALWAKSLRPSCEFLVNSPLVYVDPLGLSEQEFKSKWKDKCHILIMVGHYTTGGGTTKWWKENGPPRSGRCLKWAPISCTTQLFKPRQGNEDWVIEGFPWIRGGCGGSNGTEPMRSDWIEDFIRVIDAAWRSMCRKNPPDGKGGCCCEHVTVSVECQSDPDGIDGIAAGPGHYWNEWVKRNPKLKQFWACGAEWEYECPRSK